MRELLLAGDVGGTNVRVRILDEDGRTFEERAVRDQPVTSALAAIRKDVGPLVAACLGCMGRVVNGRVFTTNRPGETITESSVAEVLQLPVSRVRLVNDLVAHIAGLDECETNDLRAGKPVGDVEALILPGTGLGTGLRVRTIDGWLPLASEAAHASVGLESATTWEQRCSGPGLARLHGTDSKPEAVVEAFANGDELAKRSVEQFLQFLGMFAGNVCLATCATRGITVGGSLFNALCATDAEFVAHTLSTTFNKCGPDVLRDMMTSVPIRHLTSTDSGLIGAALLAEELV